MMTKQEKIEASSLSVDLVAAFAEIGGAAKDKTNPHFKSKYADLSSVVEAIKPVLARHSLAFYQRCEPSETGVLVQTILRHAGGDWLDMGTLFVPANKNDAQGFGSALTYARRYALMTAFGVPAEDDDGNAAVRPMTGEEPPPTRGNGVRKPGENFEPYEVLEGPYTSGSALRGAIKSFAERLRELGDLGEFCAWMESAEIVELEKEAIRYLPGWWDTGEGCASDFEPMTSRIQRKQRELEELESIANSPGAKMLASG